MALQAPTPTTLWTSSVPVASSPTGPLSLPGVTPFVAAAIWRESPTPGGYDPSCTPYILPSLGLLKIAPNSTITLEADATFTPICLINDTLSYLDSNSSLGPRVPQSDLRDPFYSSSIPMAYAIGGTTVLAYILLIILLISPPGSRPILQKAATLTVVISLTIAWAELNEIVEYQHAHGYSNGAQIRDHILKGLKIQIVRVISDTFLYLAQVQTLIRLFPRHREKLVIKWAGIVLIVLDTVFNVINNFFSKKGSPKSFLDAIPALSYLLQIALSLLYACCVLYYMFSHRQFSVMMPWSIHNRHKYAGDTSKVAMPLIAIITTATIFVPLVFFVLDISNQDLAGWGDFVRWIGACAASVIVWEMADRIEYFEKQTMHAGILGRQVFDGDEMLHGIGGTVVDLGGGSRSDKDDGPGGGGGNSGGASGALGRPLNSDEKMGYVLNSEAHKKGKIAENSPGRPTPPLSMAASGSTTYVIRVHPTQTPPSQGARPSSTVSRSTSSARETNHGTSTISDLAISPANTPSNETGTSGPRRAITFSDSSRPVTESPGIGQSKALPHTYRTGQAPFNPEDFSPDGSGSHGPLGLGKGLAFLKWFRRGEDSKPNWPAQRIPDDVDDGNTRHESALGQQVISFDPPSNHVSAQSSTEDDTFGDHHSIDPEVQSRSRHSSPAHIRHTPPDQNNEQQQQQQQPQPQHREDAEDEQQKQTSSLFKSIWKRKPSTDKVKTHEPFPITYIPAQARGSNPVNPQDVEDARNRELERIRAGGSSNQSSSEGTSSSPSNTSDVMVTRFEQHPNQRSMRATPGTESLNRSSVSPASRIRHSVDFDLPEGSPTGPPVSPRRHMHTHSASGTQNITPPPPVTRSSTASPSGSVRTSSTGSWQYRASPNNGGVRMTPVNPRPYNPNEGGHHVQGPTHSHSHSHSHSHQHQIVPHQPEGIGPNLPLSSKSAAPTKLLGRPLDPTVIPEEAEGSSMASIKGVDHSADEGEIQYPSITKNKGKSRED
ncbi:pH-response regulator protein palH/rim21 [Arthrobotrys conoides]|uniref:PH-response regulator protein palH/rim21 n=2 Tax=Arthrobotrys conoides TaxID=74498 RepID=A0AAN8NG32_9PEZI